MKFLGRIRRKISKKSTDTLFVLVDSHTNEQVLAFNNPMSAGIAQNIGWRDNVQQTNIVEMQRKHVNCQMAPSTYFGG